MTEATFLHGDCLEVLPTLQKDSVDLVFCDLPYGVISQHWDVRVCLDSLWPQFNRIGSGEYAALFTATFPFSYEVMSSNIKRLKHDLIWDKGASSAIAVAKYRPMPVHESILVFGTRLTYHPQMSPMTKPMTHKTRKTVNSTTGMRHKGGTYTHTYPTSILRVPVRDHNYGLHPTLKPVQLLRWLIRTYSNPGATVLDPTAGSGTTAVAALLEGRHSISIEKDPVIFANAKERVLAVQRSLRSRITQ